MIGFVIQYFSHIISSAATIKSGNFRLFIYYNKTKTNKNLLSCYGRKKLFLCIPINEVKKKIANFNFNSLSPIIHTVSYLHS